MHSAGPGTNKNPYTGCPGKVVWAQLAEQPQPAPKKKGKAPAPAPAAAAAGGPPAAAAQRPAATPQRPARARVNPGTTMSLAGAKAFLGIESSDDESGDDGGGASSAEATARRAMIQRLLNPPRPAPEPESSEPEAGSEPAASEAESTHADDAEGGEEVTASQEASDQAAVSEVLSVHSGASDAGTQGSATAATATPTFSNTPAWIQPALSEGEIEVGVREGLLPATFRTKLCKHAAPRSVVADTWRCACPQGALCPDAHFIKELRVEAAIQVRLLIPLRTCVGVDMGERSLSGNAASWACAAEGIRCHPDPRLLIE